MNYNKWNSFFSLLVFFLSLKLPAVALPIGPKKDLQTRLHQAIEKGTKNIWQEIRSEKYFDMPTSLGTPYTIQYMLYTQYANRPYLFPQKWRDVLKKRIIAERQKDGSWRKLKGPNNPTGELDATIINYFGLKVLGVDLKTPEMQKTKNYILERGGIEKTQVFLKIFLALFNNYPYKKIKLPPIPFFIFSPAPLIPDAIKAGQFGQWVVAHLRPIAYLMKYQVKKKMPPAFHLDELIKEASFRPKRHGSSQSSPLGTNEKFIEQMLHLQAENGSNGGYTLTTLLINMAFEHFLSVARPNHPLRASLLASIKKGDEFLTHKHFDKEKQKFVFSGSVVDGRAWDTALLTQALMAAKNSQNDERLLNATNYLASLQTPQGGLPFGKGFEAFPDHDDTAEIIISLQMAQIQRPYIYEKHIELGLNWLLKRQNDDGGYGAFDQNNNGNVIVKYFARNFLDSVDLFDESSADVTAHVLEALALNGKNQSNSPQILKALDYLRRVQTKDQYGVWTGRWGINYIYGTTSVLIALSALGIQNNTPLIARPVSWLLSIQNEDGGFGESSMSYHNYDLKGRGISTPSQTAWALNALVASNYHHHAASKKAVRYLIREIEKKGFWQDPYPVGTGHPGLIDMDYPSYAYAFPLIALSRYRDAINNCPHFRQSCPQK